MSEIEVVPFAERWQPGALALWGSPRMASNGVIHDATALPGVVGLIDGQFAGVVTWVPAPAGERWEILTVHSAREGVGVATRLLDAAVEATRLHGASGLRLVTTNDNLKALGFYQRRGWRITAVRPGAVDDARRDLKPEIPLRGDDGIPIRDEIELHLDVEAFEIA